MGLKERRAVKAFQEEIFPKVKEQINKEAGFDLQMNILWDTMVEDKFAHLYNQTYLKVYFTPLVEAIKAIAIDDFGKKLLNNGLKQVVIKNEGNNHNPEKGYSFENGLLTINFDPVVNSDYVDLKVSYLTALLERKLEETDTKEIPFNNDTTSKAEENVTQVKKSIDEMFHQHAGSSYEKQLNCQDVLGDKGWDFNLMEGKLTFTGNIEIPIQILGTYSPKQKSWMWGWANTQSGIPKNLLSLSNDLREFGEQNEIEEFTSSTIKNENDPGHYYAMIASGLFNASCYYPIDLNGIKIHLLTYSDYFKKQDVTPAPIIVSTFTQLVSAMEMGHKDSLFHYLNDKGFTVEHSGNNLVGKKNSEEILGIFDLRGRLMKISNR